MAGRNARTTRASSSSSNSSSHLMKVPPCTVVSTKSAVSSRSATASSGSIHKVPSMIDIISGGVKRVDKTVCQYCGVSYLTMSEMKSLQSTVKEQGECLAHYKTMVEENGRLKESLENIRKTHVHDIKRNDDEAKKNQVLEDEVSDLKRQLAESEAMNVNLAQKYSIATEDFRQQDEVISQLRDQLQEFREVQAQNSTLQKKNLELADAMKNSNQPQQEKSKTDDVANKNGNPSESGDSLPNLNPPKSASNETSKKVNNDTRSFTAVEVHDLKRLNAFLGDKIRNLTEEHSNCHEMHAFLRETVEKLKSDNISLHEHTNGLKMKCEQAVIELENMNAKLEGMSTENGGLRQSVTDLEQKLNISMSNNKTLKKSQNPKGTEQFKLTILSLQKELYAQKEILDQQINDYENKLSVAQREINMEKERADSCLRAIVTEREEVEKRWEERWNRHQVSLNEQLDSLKNSYDRTVTTAKEMGEALQSDLYQVKEQYDQSKAEWDAYNKVLTDQVKKLKKSCETKDSELESTHKSKIEIEVMLQDKHAELENLHEMVREGCEERQELQKKIELLEEYIEERRSHGSLQKRRSAILFEHKLPTTSKELTPRSASAVILSTTNNELGDPFSSVKESQKQNSEIKNPIGSSVIKSTDPIIQFTVGKGRVTLPTKPGAAVKKSQSSKSNNQQSPTPPPSHPVSNNQIPLTKGPHKNSVSSISLPLTSSKKEKESSSSIPSSRKKVKKLVK